MRPTIVHPDTLTRERLLAVSAVRATDGEISTVVWDNPTPAAEPEILVSVREVTPEYVEPVRRWIQFLLIEG